MFRCLSRERERKRDRSAPSFFFVVEVAVSVSSFFRTIESFFLGKNSTPLSLVVSKWFPPASYRAALSGPQASRCR